MSNGDDEQTPVRLARIEERLNAVQKKADSTQTLVIGILVTTLGTLLTAGVGIVMLLVQRT